MAFIPSPPVNGFHVGPLFIHYYGLMYVIGIALAILITQRRWKARGGDPSLVGDVAIWAVPAGIVGGRIYFDLTTPKYIPHHWYGVFAVWDGGLGIWGGIALATVVGAWRVRRHGASVSLFMDAVAPALLVAQAIGRIGNYFNKELFGGPATLPWALEVPLAYRPPGYARYATFQPSFLYELLFDLALAGLLVWLGNRRNIKPPGLFALYVTGYSAYRIFEESIRIDYSQYLLGLRLNMYVAAALTVAGAVWFWRTQRRREAPAGHPAGGSGPAGEGGDRPAPAQALAQVPGTGGNPRSDSPVPGREQQAGAAGSPPAGGGPAAGGSPAAP
jgi:prolipoprotein diacylglyceryl transferase